MYHYYESIANAHGDVLPGFYVRAVDLTTLAAITIYADKNLTPIVSVSGLAGAAQVDTDGNVSFYTLANTAHIDIYGPDGTTFIKRVPDASMGGPIDGNLATIVTPQAFGALADGTTDDSAAFVAAIAALKAYALNTGGGGFYKGSPKLFIPAGNYYLGTTALDINHTLIIEGEGSGQFGPQAFGCTQLRWAAGTSGIRVQAANTSGETAHDDINIHDGSGGVVLRDLCLEGGFDGTTEGDYHGLVLRNAVKAYNLYIKNWPGEGVKAWAGNVTGFGSVSGNLSTTLLVSVKTEFNRGGIDIRGADANIITTINCEGYTNRQFGILDDAGAGANIHIGPHLATNGGYTGSWPQTQCSYSGNRYAAVWGGDPTVAPSGDTTDTVNWLYIEAGAAIANTIPAWVNTANTFRAGGDMLTLNSSASQFVNPYSESGGFSQFTASTKIDGGTLSAKYFRGGALLTSNGANGLAVKIHGPNHFALDFDGTEGGFVVRNLSDAAELAYLVFERGDSWQLDNGLNIHTGALRFGEVAAIDASRNATLASAALGGGTALTKSAVYTPSITPSSVAAATVAEQTFTVSGLTTADKVIVNPPAIANSTGVAGARVSAADTLAIRFTNPTAGALTPTSGTYTVLAFRS